MKRFFLLLLGISLCIGMPTFLEAREGAVRGSYINLRSDNNFKAPIIGKKVRGQKYKVLFEEKSWLKVKFTDGTEAWIYETLAEKNRPGETVDTSEETPEISSGTGTLLPPLPVAIASGTKEKVGEGKVDGKTDKDKLPKGTEIITAKATDKPGDKKKKSDLKSVVGKSGEEGKGKGKGKGETGETPVASFPSVEGGPSKILSFSKSPEEYYNEAIDLFEKKKYAEALEANRCAYQQAPSNAEILNNMANCLFKMGKTEDALKQWKEALTISPKSAKICNNMAIAYYQNDENEKAVEYYKKAILFEPDFPDPYYNIASVYGFRGDFKDALDTYKKYLEFSIDPVMKQLTEERIEYCQKQLNLQAKKEDKKDDRKEEKREARK